MYLKWQMQTIIINSKLEFLFLPNMLAPVELFPTRENLAALKVLAFLSRLGTENKPLGLLILSSKMPRYGMQIRRDIESIELAKLLTPKLGSLAHCR